MAESGKIDPMHQFTIEPLFGTDHWAIGGYNIAFTNSALWMVIATVVLWVFVALGMKRQLVPGRWQMAVETMTGFIDNLLTQNVGPEGKKFVPYVFSLFMFILVANLLGLVPLGLVGSHAFTFTSHFTATGVLAIMSFAIVLIVGFWRHKLHFFSLFVPHGTPAWLLPLDSADRTDLLHGPSVQPRPATVRGDDGRTHPAGSAVELHHLQRALQHLLGPRDRPAQFHPDDRDQRP